MTDSSSSAPRQEGVRIGNRTVDRARTADPLDVRVARLEEHLARIEVKLLELLNEGDQ